MPQIRAYWSLKMMQFQYEDIALMTHQTKEMQADIWLM